MDSLFACVHQYCTPVKQEWLLFEGTHDRHQLFRDGLRVGHEPVDVSVAPSEQEEQDLPGQQQDFHARAWTHVLPLRLVSLGVDELSVHPHAVDLTQ